MPKRKSRNQSLKQRVKALEMHLGVSKLSFRLSLEVGQAGRIAAGFGSLGCMPLAFLESTLKLQPDAVSVE